MLVVGTDQVRIDAGQVTPAGEQHAVRLDGAALCSDRPVAYTFPALPWVAGAQTSDSCEQCVSVLTTTAVPAVPAPAYPLDPTVAESFAFDAAALDAESAASGEQLTG